MTIVKASAARPCPPIIRKPNSVEHQCGLSDMIQSMPGERHRQRVEHEAGAADPLDRRRLTLTSPVSCRFDQPVQSVDKPTSRRSRSPRGR